MRFATYRPADRADDPSTERVGLVVGDEVRGLEPGITLLSLLGDSFADKLGEAAQRAEREPNDVRILGTTHLRPLLPRPPSIRDFSVFEQHIRKGLQAMGKELGADWYEIPAFYFTSPNMMYGSGETVVVPGHTTEMDFELEAACIVGKAGIDIDLTDADSHIAGYTIYNDWTARDLQRRELNTMPIGPSKGKDFAMSLGPFLVTPDELESKRKTRSFDLRCTVHVNGQQYSDGNLAEMWFGFDELVAYASRSVWLEPGDVLGTGTCSTGCILELSQTFGHDAYPWLAEGDHIALEIELLGRLENSVTWGELPKPLHNRDARPTRQDA